MARDKYSTWNKYDTEKNDALQKWQTLRENAQKLLAKGWTKWFLKQNSYICFMIQTHGHGILKSSFFHSRLIFLLLTCV